MTTGKRAERTNLDLRCPMCRPATGQASSVFDLRAPLSTHVPALLQNQPNQANITHLHKKGFALILYLSKVKVFGTRKWSVVAVKPLLKRLCIETSLHSSVIKTVHFPDILEASESRS